ncbi:hypothetical protein EJP67_10705 [Variovorax guangxiensis]|uniref:Uncharacterized protein n=1 Tax=Variovorax guangxiensis TaxID=1775474 RepID=A0A3S1A2N1_9BURK|nr:hypothetical protein EJP67_10705 [Variovorax guangxiensis]
MAATDVKAGRLAPALPQYRRAVRDLSVMYDASHEQVPKAVSVFVDMAVRKFNSRS